MPSPSDPFAHVPELRSRIKAAEESFFRSFSLDSVLAENPQPERVRAWAHSDAAREAFRAEALAGHEGDLWVFAYGSLMWDPALRFAEVRRAHAPSHERRFILIENKGGRGMPEAPGLIAALDAGAGCDGLAFRIRAEAVDAETEILFRREMIGPGYIAAFIPVRIADQEVRALSFLADHAIEEVVGDISAADQVRFVATGAGRLGTSREYLANIVAQFAHLGIQDAECSALLRKVDAFIADAASKRADR